MTTEAKYLVSTLDEASLQLGILEISKSYLLRQQQREASVSDFWTKVALKLNSRTAESLQCSYFIIVFYNEHHQEPG